MVTRLLEQMVQLLAGKGEPRAQFVASASLVVRPYHDLDGGGEIPSEKLVAH